MNTTGAEEPVSDVVPQPILRSANCQRGALNLHVELKETENANKGQKVDSHGHPIHPGLIHTDEVVSTRKELEEYELQTEIKQSQDSPWISIGGFRPIVLYNSLQTCAVEHEKTSSSTSHAMGKVN